MLRSAALVLALTISAGAADARDLVYAARIGADGMPVEQRSLVCDLGTGCMLAFDSAAEDWRSPLSLQLVANGGRMVLTARAEGAPDGPLLVASDGIAMDGQGGAMATVQLRPPPSRKAGPAWLAGDRPAEGFGPFLIAVHHTPD